MMNMVMNDAYGEGERRLRDYGLGVRRLKAVECWLEEIDDDGAVMMVWGLGMETERRQPWGCVLKKLPWPMILW